MFANVFYLVCSGHLQLLFAVGDTPYFFQVFAFIPDNVSYKIKEIIEMVFEYVRGELECQMLVT